MSDPELEVRACLQADARRDFATRISRIRVYLKPEHAFAAAPPRRRVDGYVDAWASNDPGAIGAGRLEHADAPGAADFRWFHPARDGDLWLIEGRTDYVRLGRTYANLWLVRLDEEARALTFSEWWKQIPDGVVGRADRL